MESTFTNPTCKKLHDYAFKVLQQRCCTRQYAFSIPAAAVNASSVKSFKTPLDANWQSLIPKVPI